MGFYFLGTKDVQHNELLRNHSWWSRVVVNFGDGNGFEDRETIRPSGERFSNVNGQCGGWRRMVRQGNPKMLGV
jgi:hypothetical protein